MADLDFNTENTSKHKGFKAIAGFLFIVLGVLVFVKDYEFVPPVVTEYIISWQTLLIVIGVLSILRHKEHFVGGIILITIGGFFIANKYYTIPVSGAQVFWSALLVYAGVAILFYRSKTKFQRCKTSNSFKEQIKAEDKIDEVNIFSGSKTRIESQNFSGGEIVSIFGGSELDLRDAKLAEGTNVLEVTFVFGGASIMVPPNWHVKLDATGILGGFADKRYRSPNEHVDRDRTLIIRGVALFGGGEIKFS